MTTWETLSEWLAQLDVNSVIIGLLAGLIIAFAAAVISARIARRRGAEEVSGHLQPINDALASDLVERETELSEIQRALAVSETRLEEQQLHYRKEKASLEEAEKRLTESFERLAGKVFDERSSQFTQLSEKQLSGLLKPLTKDLESFRDTVDKTSREDIRQHAALQEKLRQMETLNERLHKEAQNLTKALTSDVKAQGNWGEQQLERLMELAGLIKGEHYYTQYSTVGNHGERLQPDFVLRLPENRSIILDSKVSLTAWTRYQSEEDEGRKETLLAEHVASIKAHISGLGKKNYPDVEELNALDFVLMFVPIESALIVALQRDPGLPEYALQQRVALLSPANFLATVRTVASVWQVHKQNTNAQDIARRAGLLYDKFVGFTENMKNIGMRLEQARKSFDDAYNQLSSGAGNLVGQVDKLSKLGARHAKQLEAGLVEKAMEESLEDDAHLRLVKGEDETP
ncbi:MAG: DNA recombination protein RmuC [Gammaproteobacteria bacterium]|nr:DNA recombination protein RmuC [Gammaproteobacteria bacterium]NNK99012.1 DNA recombination protein RmuC [Xanthomonadales bacterium]